MKLTSPGLVVSLDLPVAESVALVQKLTAVEDLIAAYKISSLHALDAGLKGAVSSFRQFTQKPLVYDHQKAATDIPQIVDKQVRAVAAAGANAFIAVPQGAGPKTLEAFVQTCQETKIKPIVLVSMTHPQASHYLRVDAPKEIFTAAAEFGVTDFVAPANHPEILETVRAWIGNRDLHIWSPGVGAQGGQATEAVKSGTDFPIVGRGVYAAEDPVAATKELYDQIKAGWKQR